MTGIIPYQQKQVFQPTSAAPIPSGGGKGAGLIPSLFGDVLLSVATQGLGSGLSGLLHTGSNIAGPSSYFASSMMAQPIFPVPIP